MSCGQHSQVVLGVIMAQNPDLLILDDYSMGLDAGYRRLFLDVLHEFAGQDGKTIFVTSHIVQELEQLVDTMIFLDKDEILQTGLEEFMGSFHKYVFHDDNRFTLEPDEVIKGFEQRGRQVALYSFAGEERVQGHLAAMGIRPHNFHPAAMTLEDAFIGLMGKY